MFVMAMLVSLLVLAAAAKLVDDGLDVDNNGLRNNINFAKESLVERASIDQITEVPAECSAGLELSVAQMVEHRQPELVGKDPVVESMVGFFAVPDGTRTMSLWISRFAFLESFLSGCERHRFSLPVNRGRGGI